MTYSKNHFHFFSLLVSCGLLFICAYSVEASIRSFNSRVLSDMRSLATAIEAYKTDCGKYPPYLECITTPVAYATSIFPDPHKMKYEIRYSNVFSYFFSKYGLFYLIVNILILFEIIRYCIKKHTLPKLFIKVAIFMIIPFIIIMAILAYQHVSKSMMHMPEVHELRSYSDWKNKYQGFHYYTDGSKGWILQSVGPNQTRDFFDLDKMSYDSVETTYGAPPYINYVYDSTNGTNSFGDTFRSSIKP